MLLSDILDDVNYMIECLNKSSIVTKEDLEIGLSLDELEVEDKKAIRKELSRVFKNSDRSLKKYNKVLQNMYSSMINEGVVFFVETSDACIDDICRIPVQIVGEAYSDLDDKDVYDIGLDKYMMIHKLSDGVMGVSRFKYDGKTFIHCFLVGGIGGNVQTTLLIEDENGISNILCGKALQCDLSSINCKQYVTEGVNCSNARYFALSSMVCKNVLSKCLNDSLYAIIRDLAIESISLRENERLVGGKEIKSPTVIIGAKDEILVHITERNTLQFTRSV